MALPAWGTKTLVMGIINITDDSFSGDGLLTHANPVTRALQQARDMKQSGAHIIDLGAESSRPGAEPISAAQEMDRLLPVIDALTQQRLDVVISVDTYKPAVAEAALNHGAHWINDIWGLKKNPDLARVVSAFKAPIILMHNRTRLNKIDTDPKLGGSYHEPAYQDFMAELMRDLRESVHIANRAGIPDSRIILDPGIGFGKSVRHNLQIINQLGTLKTLGFPLLIGPSRKSFIGRVLQVEVDQRMEGTAATVAVGIARGADIIRVHDVAKMAPVAAMADAIVRENYFRAEE